MYFSAVFDKREMSDAPEGGKLVFERLSKTKNKTKLLT